MQKIEISDRDVVPLSDVAPGVAGLRMLFVNIFGVVSPDGTWTLVDAGLYLSADRIRRWARHQFGERAPAAILLTHAHFDHVGSIRELLEHWKVPVYAHEDELPFLTGKEEYPAPDPTVGGGMMAWMSPLYPRGPIDITNHVYPLPPNGVLPTLEGWQWIHTPGHTLGHVSFFREGDRTLLVGDAFCTTKTESLLAVAQQRPELHGPPAYYTPDWEQAKASIQKLAGLKPNILAPGHGQPMAGADVPRALESLARNFDQVAKPEHGKYVA